jgi:hypothetical protein
MTNLNNSDSSNGSAGLVASPEGSSSPVSNKPSVLNLSNSLAIRLNGVYLDAICMGQTVNLQKTRLIRKPSGVASTQYLSLTEDIGHQFNRPQTLREELRDEIVSYDDEPISPAGNSNLKPRIVMGTPTCGCTGWVVRLPQPHRIKPQLLSQATNGGISRSEDQQRYELEKTFPLRGENRNVNGSVQIFVPPARDKKSTM